MARLSPEEWAECRMLRESTGMSFRLLAEKFGVSDVAVLKRSKKESWGDGGNANAIANRWAQDKAAGIVANKGQNFAQRTASINEAADKKAALIIRQQEDWEEHRREFAKPVPIPDPETAEPVHEDGKARAGRLMASKVAAEVLRIRHEGERRAYGITDEGDARQNSGKPLSAFYGA